MAFIEHLYSDKSDITYLLNYSSSLQQVCAVCILNERILVFHDENMVYNYSLWHEVGIKICFLVPSVNWHMFWQEHHNNECIVQITVTSAEFSTYNIKMLSVCHVSVSHDLLLIKFSLTSSVLGWGTVLPTFGKQIRPSHNLSFEACVCNVSFQTWWIILLKSDRCHCSSAAVTSVRFEKN